MRTIRKCHIHTLQANTRHCEENTQQVNSDNTIAVKQTTLSYSARRLNGCQSRKDTKNLAIKQGFNTLITYTLNWTNTKYWINNRI